MKPDETPQSTPETTDEKSTLDLPSAPEDALSRTPDDLEEERAAEQAAASIDIDNVSEKSIKKPSAIKRFFRKINLYFLIFILLVIVGGAITVVTYLNSQKEPIVPSIAAQELDEKSLQQLANNDTSVGDVSQTLTIQGNAIIEGQALLRRDLNVAGNLQTGGEIRGPSITISGAANLGATQAQSLQVSGSLAIQGGTTLRDLNVAGTSSFSGAVTASQLTVTRLIMSGNASLEVPNHISFNGPSPSRTINAGVLGGGGSASVNGSDTSGTININTGNSPAAGCFTRVNFRQGFTRQPRVMVTPVGVTAGQINYYVTRDNGGFSICTANPAPAHRAFAFDYFVAG